MKTDTESIISIWIPDRVAENSYEISKIINKPKGIVL